jgi:diphthamide biosynthesis methyltransferase
MAARRTRRRQEAVIETVQASAGEAQRLDQRRMRLRAAAPQLLSEEALRERQASISETRKAPGPQRRGRADRRIDASRVPEVEPTDVEDPADEP